MNMGTAKVYPNAPSPTSTPECYGNGDGGGVALTVWKKSLLFNCEGFTVFGADGKLAYRVDNYASGSKGEIVLMDAAGTPLLTIRRKRLSLWDTWMVFDGETGGNPRLLMRKNMQLLPHGSRCLAHVMSSGGKRHKKSEVLYEIEGSYERRCCAVYDEKRKRRVVEMKPKEAPVKGVALGGDVFRLVVNPGMDGAAAMAIVILLDQMFGSSN